MQAILRAVLIMAAASAFACAGDAPPSVTAAWRFDELPLFVDAHIPTDRGPVLRDSLRVFRYWSPDGRVVPIDAAEGYDLLPDHQPAAHGRRLVFRDRQVAWNHQELPWTESLVVFDAATEQVEDVRVDFPDQALHPEVQAHLSDAHAGPGAIAWNVTVECGFGDCGDTSGTEYWGGGEHNYAYVRAEGFRAVRIPGEALGFDAQGFVVSRTGSPYQILRHDPRSGALAGVPFSPEGIGGHYFFGPFTIFEHTVIGFGTDERGTLFYQLDGEGADRRWIFVAAAEGSSGTGPRIEPPFLVYQTAGRAYRYDPARRELITIHMKREGWSTGLGLVRLSPERGGLDLQLVRSDESEPISFGNVCDFYGPNDCERAAVNPDVLRFDIIHTNDSELRAIAYAGRQILFTIPIR